MVEIIKKKEASMTPEQREKIENAKKPLPVTAAPGGKPGGAPAAGGKAGADKKKK